MIGNNYSPKEPIWPTFASCQNLGSRRDDSHGDNYKVHGNRWWWSWLRMDACAGVEPALNIYLKQLSACSLERNAAAKDGQVGECREGQLREGDDLITGGDLSGFFSKEMKNWCKLRSGWRIRKRVAASSSCKTETSFVLKLFKTSPSLLYAHLLSTCEGPPCIIGMGLLTG